MTVREDATTGGFVPSTVMQGDGEPTHTGTANGGLFGAASRLIEDAQRVVATTANAATTVLYWRLGRLVAQEVLSNLRADYGQEIVSALATQLVQRYGRTFQMRNLRRMIQFSQEFADLEIVSALATQLTWTHFVELLPVKTSEARLFYADRAAKLHLSTKELRGVIDRKAYERREIANSQIAAGSSTPLDAFLDPYLLDFLGLEDTFHERDLEAAIIHELEPFLLEVGHGWTFVARQKRMIVDGDDFYLDLLFYSRLMRRLIAVELKVGKFKPAHKAQMELYLRWLDRYERQEGEEAPIGLILCTEASRERIELLQMHKDGIVVAEYWTALPPKQELEQRLNEILRRAQERLALRQIASSTVGSGE